MSSCRILSAGSRGAIDEALAALRSGGIVAIPTETFYGLAVDPWNPVAVRRLVELKGRGASSPFPLIAGSLQQITEIFGSPPERFLALARAFWPGPLTLVIEAAKGLDPATVSSRGGAAVRVPGLRFAREVPQALGRVITATSANRTAAPPARLPREVESELGTGLSLLIDGGETPGGLPSTVVDLLDEGPVLVREGAIPAAALQRVLGRPLSGLF